MIAHYVFENRSRREYTIVHDSYEKVEEIKSYLKPNGEDIYVYPEKPINHVEYLDKQGYKKIISYIEWFGNFG